MSDVYRGKLTESPDISPVISTSSDLGLNGLDIQVIQAPVRRLFGLPIHALRMAETISLCEKTIDSKTQIIIGVVNAAKVVNMRRVPLLGEAVLQSNLVLADGMAVVWASRLLRQPLPERIAGIDLFEQLLRLANLRHYSVYLLGASQEILERVVSSIENRYPHVRIVGARNGYFKDDQSEEIANDIRRGHPDMVFLGMTSPMKEIFLARWAAHMQVPVCHGVGGSFDVMAGKVRRAPLPWQKLGLEWLYRVLQEPRRMWRRYLVTNSLFIGLVLREFMHPMPPMRLRKAEMSAADAKNT